MKVASASIRIASHPVGGSLKFNATGMQRANFVVSIGCPRILELCNEDARTLPAGRLTYRAAR